MLNRNILMHRPYIGITVDSLEGSSNGYSRVPWYALRHNHVDTITRAGGTPILLPHSLNSISAYMHILHGIIITGGDFHIPPHLYDEKQVRENMRFKPERTAFEMALTDECLKNNKPILGICGGMQVINVAQGGSLQQDIRHKEGGLDHAQKPPYNQAGHSIIIEEGTRMLKLAESSHEEGGRSIGELHVNTSHTQAIDCIGRDLKVSARAPDGIIEAIEHTSHPYCVGVQWHPEYEVSPFDTAIFNSFIDACKEHT